MTGVLLMAHGAAEGLEDIERYFTHIRHGRPPSPEALLELTRRYRAIGGHSPLKAVTERQARGLQQRLGRESFVVAYGFRHASPDIADGVERLLSQGAHRVVGLVLAPHYSPFSVGAYLREAERAVDGRVPWIPITSWHLAPGLVEALSGRVIRVLEPESTVLFTAHSLPLRVLADDDPYPRQVKETAGAVMERVGRPVPWEVSWQSAGMTDEDWLGPDLFSELRRLGGGGATHAVLCPSGFVSDHLEILYDLDIEAKKVADGVNLRLTRTPSLNDHPDLVNTLADVVREALDR